MCDRRRTGRQNTDAGSFLELPSDLTEAVHVSIDPPVPPFTVELFVRVKDMGAAITELVDDEEELARHGV